ncbi:MAG: 3-methyl-2-oxobutanoate hydroxymethyltransferase [Thaumarchaeota archaeon]|jgi:3-methyl-2-oxobutanoate hydroxymethyltransferase|nr:3-methyl-2-oxobutanoate hydroxymethyltransferase [Nitrososphaerota archaeon]MBT3743952.1 3-methyl-2-oxobutanoate hydroxymethyltransferase [Nitrososphaerota archaeon]MBT4057680.1 3-methyl-2-oxobutanoate hydroxymethyltransferase [Nitrososphaerota archaeon]MBT4176161.1 3-methyl-2-oxobutanoate hydroxymethyltransferase [Nitrososphaerota archaeon]MBT4510471.1 3-methyl-2-oxobutanoate hydroxymethyltransferase [Nitrososphaerota archaeon]
MSKTVNDIMQMKSKEKITVLTGYDSTMTTLCDKADVILVGDSAGMVMLGYDSTKDVTMDDMVRFTTAVKNAKTNSLIVTDLPINSYENEDLAIANSKRLVLAGAHAVKLEGGKEVADIIKAVKDSGIPVMGHLGLLPQTAEKYSVQAKKSEDAIGLIKDAKILEKSGVFSIVLEMVTSDVTKIVTKNVTVPTIGIGSGKDCDGQVLVIHDMLGMFEKIKPKFAKRYLNLSEEIRNAVSSYVKDVKEERFPEQEHTFSMEKDELEKLEKDNV